MSPSRWKSLAVAIVLVSSMASSAAAQFPNFEPLDRNQFEQLLEEARVAESDRDLAHMVRRWHDHTLQELNGILSRIQRWRGHLSQPAGLRGYEELVGSTPVARGTTGATGEAVMRIVWEADEELHARLSILVPPGLPEVLLREYISRIRFQRVVAQVHRMQFVRDDRIIFAITHLSELLGDAGVELIQLGVGETLDWYRGYLERADEAVWQYWLAYLQRYRDTIPNNAYALQRQAERDGDIKRVAQLTRETEYSYTVLVEKMEETGRLTWDAGVELSMLLPDEAGVRLRFVLRQHILAPMMDTDWPDLMAWLADPRPHRNKRETILTMDSLLRGWEQTYLTTFANGSGWRRVTDDRIARILDELREHHPDAIIPDDEIGHKARAAKQRADESLKPILEYGRGMMQAEERR